MYCHCGDNSTFGLSSPPAKLLLILQGPTMIAHISCFQQSSYAPCSQNWRASRLPSQMSPLSCDELLCVSVYPLLPSSRLSHLSLVASDTQTALETLIQQKLSGTVPRNTTASQMAPRAPVGAGNLKLLLGRGRPRHGTSKDATRVWGWVQGDVGVG